MSGVQRVTVPRLVAQKGREPIVAMTAYDFPTAAVADEAGVDLILVGDSLNMVVLGEPTTLSVTMEDMLHHARAVSRGAKRPLVVGDMPFGSYHESAADAVRNAVRFVRDGGVSAIKLEGGRKRVGVVRAILDAEIPVLGHIGLTPQSFHAFGGFKVQGRTEDAAARLLDDAKALEEAGCFALVLECVPSEVAAKITRALRIPTIGIGAGPSCDGQILVFHDALGWPTGHRTPKFVRTFAKVHDEAKKGLEAYAASVRNRTFPTPAESFSVEDPPPPSSSRPTMLVASSLAAELEDSGAIPLTKPSYGADEEGDTLPAGKKRRKTTTQAAAEKPAETAEAKPVEEPKKADPEMPISPDDDPLNEPTKVSRR